MGKLAETQLLWNSILLYDFVAELHLIAHNYDLVAKLCARCSYKIAKGPNLINIRLRVDPLLYDTFQYLY